MNKLLIAVPFALGTMGAVALAATSQFSGEQTKAEYEQLLAQLNALAPAIFVNESYETGVGKSTAVTRVQSTLADDSDVWFFLHHEIDHSAVKKDDDGLHIGTVTISTTLHQENVEQKDIVEMFEDSTPFRLVTDIQHTGEMRNRFTVNASTPELAADGISWDGLELDVVTKDQAIVGGGKLGRLNFTDPEDGMEFSIEDSPFDLDLVLHESIGYVGDVSSVINELTMSSPQRPEMRITQIGIKSESTIDDNSLDTALSFDVQGIQSIMPISNASLDVSLDGLGVKGMSLLSDLLQPENAELGEDQMQTEILRALKDMLQPGSLMNLNLLLNNRGGDVVTDLNIAIKEEGEQGMSADALDNIVTQRDVLNVINLNGVLNADRSALDLTPVMIFIGAAGKYVTVSEESVTSSVTLEGSTLNINGVMLPLEQLMGSLDQPFADIFRR